MSRHETIVEVIEQIKKDLWVDDHSAIYELLECIPQINLENFLSE